MAASPFSWTNSHLYVSLLTILSAGFAQHDKWDPKLEVALEVVYDIWRKQRLWAHLSDFCPLAYRFL